MTDVHRAYALLTTPVLGLALVLTACGSHPTQDTIAEFDGGVITRPEFDAYLQSMDKRKVRTDAEVTAEEGLRELLREYAATRILAAEGSVPGPPFEPVLFVSPKTRFLVQYYQQRTGKRGHEVSEEEARAAYDELVETRYTLPEKIRFQHVFLRSDLHPSGELDSLVATIVGQHRSGVPLTDLVARYSESGSKTREGIVGPVYRGRLEEGFEEQLFALPVSDDLAVIRTALGTHLVVVLEKHESRVLPYDEVKSQVVAGLINRRDEAEREKLFRALRERHGVVDRTDDDGLGDDDVALTIGDRSVTRAALATYLERSAPFGGAHQGASPRARRVMVDNLIDFNLMYLDAVDQGLDQEPNFVERWQLNEQAIKARTALGERVGQWTESVDEKQVLEFFRQHEARFSLPRRLDLSYIFVPFGALSPFEQQLKIEELKRFAVSEDFDSPVLAERCDAEGAICVNAGLVSVRDIGRVGPKVQRAALDLEAPGVSDPIKGENGLYVVAVHGSEERRPMVPPDDMPSMRARYVQLEEKRIIAEIREHLLDEKHYRVVAPLTTDSVSAPRE